VSALGSFPKNLSWQRPQITAERSKPLANTDTKLLYHVIFTGGRPLRGLNSVA
jgi:hypothetical protein